jgi:hypothetical protein
MHVISSFEQSTYLELAINQLQLKGINKEQIAAVPLEQLTIERKLFDTIHQTDGISLLDGAAVLATVFSVLGASFGFELKWGPIIWGLLGLVFGAGLGFLLDLFIRKRKSKKRQAKNFNTEVVLIVHCEESEFKMVKEILSEHKALAIGKLPYN